MPHDQLKLKEGYCFCSVCAAALRLWSEEHMTATRRQALRSKIESSWGFFKENTQATIGWETDPETETHDSGLLIWACACKTVPRLAERRGCSSLVGNWNLPQAEAWEKILTWIGTSSKMGADSRTCASEGETRLQNLVLPAACLALTMGRWTLEGLDDERVRA